MKPHLPKFLLAAILLLGNYANGATALVKDDRGYTLYIEDENEFSVDATSTGTDITTMIYAKDGMENTNFGISPGENELDATIGTLTMNAGVTATVQRNPWKGSNNNNIRDFGSLTIKNLVVKGEGGANFAVEENQGPVVINAVSGSLNNLTNKGTLTLNGATTVKGTLTANSGSTLTVNDVLTITDASKNGVLSINANSSIETGENGYIKYSNANVTSYEVTLEDHTTLGKNFQFTGGLIINGKGYEKPNGVDERTTDRYIDVDSGKSLIVGGALDLVSTVHMRIKGGHVEASALNMAHPDSNHQNKHYTGKLTMESGSLKLGAITFRKTNASYANEFNVTGGTLEFTAENVLNKQNGAAHAIVNITGSGSADSERVTLKAIETAWTIDGNGYTTMPTIGNVTIDAANTKRITFKNASLSGNIVNNAQLAIGSVTVGADKTATLSNAGSVSFVSGSVLTLNERSNLTLDNAGTIIFNNYDSNAGIKATGSGTLTVGSGTTVELTNSDQSNTGAIGGTIKVQGGGRLLLSGSGASLLGYDGNATDAIYLAGEENNLATMNITTTANQHLSTDLYLQGYAQIIGSGTIESYLFNKVGKINVGGVSNKIDANIALNRPLTINVAKDGELVVNGVISAADSGTKNLIKEGSGTLTLRGNNTYTGTTTVSGGKVVVDAGSRLGSGDVTITNATVEATHRSSNGTSVMGNQSSTVTINGGGTLTLKGHDMLGYGGSRLGNLKLVGESATNLAQLYIDEDSDQSMTLHTNVTMEGNSRLSGNKLNTFGTSFTVTGGDNKIDIATFELRNDWNVTVDNQLIDGQVIEGILEISSTLTNSSEGKGKLIKKGSGTLLISGTGNNTFSQGVTIDGGVLQLGKSSALGSGAVTVNDGGTLDMNGTADVENAVTLKEGATLTNTGDEIVNGKKQLPNVTLEGDATVTGSENFAMVASGHGQAYLNLNTHTLTKEGSNTFTLSNTAVSAGTLKVLRGTLNAQSRSNDLGGSLDISEATVEVGRVNADDVGTFQLTGSSEAIKALKFDGGEVSVENGHKLTVSGATTVTSNGGTMQGAVQLNTLSVDGKLKIGDGSTKGVIISSNLNSQTGTLGGTITSDAANTTISLAGAGVDNKAIISNALIDIMAGSTFDLSNAVVADTSRITDAAATLSVSNVQMDVTVGTNATAEASTLPVGGVTLQQMGDSETVKTVNVSEGTKVLAITSSLMDTVTVSGSELTINLNGLYGYGVKNYGYVSLTFTNEGKTAASFSTGLGVNIAYAGSILSAPVYFDTTESNVTTLYVGVTDQLIDAAAVPEPTTTTLSLLALSGLMLRRRRKQ